MATQKACTDALKEWLEAEEFAKAVEAAGKAATEFDGLYEESATNLLKRTPDLFMLLTAFQAGRLHGQTEEAKKHEPVQEGLL